MRPIHLLLLAAAVSRTESQSRVDLATDWRLQSAAVATETGATISTPTFAPANWYLTTVPTTVLAALVANRVYPDPYVGMNLRAIPGASYPIGRNFANLAMPDDSPFRKAWWFRRTFTLPAAMRGQRIALHFDGVNYRANVWLNGAQIARSDALVGTYRLFDLDITDAVRATGTNVLAVEVSAPDVLDLAMTWVDWNPAPPDKDMGLWRPVYLTSSGGIALRSPLVVSHVDSATLKTADLSPLIEARNLTASPITTTVTATLGPIGRALTQTVTVPAHGTTIVRFPRTRVTNPALWWPAGMGEQPLHDGTFAATVGGAVSDRVTTRFGIREITSSMTTTGGRLFRINGRRVLIRGGGWAPDMMLRASPERQEAEIRYTRDMGLNTIRLEGKHEDEHFMDLADRYGIFVMTGWSCCDQWEQWRKWTPEDTVVAFQSQRDQIRRIRNRASLVMWLNGSDNPPPAQIESTYVSILRELDFPDPVVSSATGKRAAYSGASGVKMNGPYDWVPPGYWMLDSTHGGAFGFNTETSPGAAVPPIETLRTMFGGEPTWPPDSTWLFHAGGGQFANLKVFTEALTARYGAPTSAADFAAKSQLMTYEGERAMFEAFSRNRYNATGIIQWMLNNAWPSLIWHLYDYDLRPGGGYFGTKKAFEPVHAMYSYDDRSIAVANGTRVALTGATLTVRMLGLDGAELSRQRMRLDVPPDSVVRPAVLPAAPAGTGVYFVDLTVTSSAGAPLSRNLYWLSAGMDDPDLPKSTWYGTPVKSYADFTALQSMPSATLTQSLRLTRTGATETARVTLTNSGTVPAFFIRLSIRKGPDGDEALPILWEDNYVSIPAGESRTISASYSVASLGGRVAALAVTGQNVK